MFFHYDMLSKEKGDLRLAELKTAVEEKDLPIIELLLAMRGVPAMLRARAGNGTTPTEREIRDLFAKAVQMASDAVTPSCWLWLAITIPYRMGDLRGLIAMHQKARNAADGSMHWLVELVGLHSEASLRSNMGSPEAAAIINRGVLSTISLHPDLHGLHVVDQLRVKATYGVLIHSQRAHMPGDYIEGYRQLVAIAEAAQMPEVVTAAWRECARAMLVEGMPKIAAETVRTALRIAQEYDYAWHIEQAKKLDAEIQNALSKN